MNHRCDVCSHLNHQDRSLHLVSSAGTPLSARTPDWSAVDGKFHRVELGSGKVGHIAASGESVLLENTADDQQWIVDQRWTAEEGIVSFAGHPLAFRGEILGVLALFSRDRLGPNDFEWLRSFADHAAIAIANARAFEEVERLRGQLESENRYLREEVNAAHAFGEIIGESAALQKVMEQIHVVAPTSASVLILGESGTGKELVARAIHRHSQRSDRPLVKVNCAAVPRELFESEFFGHVKGSFTGAFKDRVGRFQLANGGTLFLDEVGEIPLESQGKLLRVLQEGQIERVGDDETRRVDVRVIAATNKDLEAEVAAGRFRRDLYFRLSVFPVEVLPLRERAEDIPLLANHFAQQYCKRMNQPVRRLSSESVQQFQQYSWPGNVRELQNVIERAVISSLNDPVNFNNCLVASIRFEKRPVGRLIHRLNVNRTSIMTAHELAALETENLRTAMERTHWKIYGPGGAAKLLGMRPTTLTSRLKRLGLRKPR
ncbi:MAG TPA: sigma 54-interacting transcriptional regulator [Pirellulales bacterium]|nr:sigma 54-interacting transcriptional regulator [Pirellulales bacterium]